MYLIRSLYVVTRRKFVFRSRNYRFRRFTGGINSAFERGPRDKTTEFGLTTDGGQSPSPIRQRFCPVRSGGKRLFLGSQARSGAERSMSFIRVCSPRYDDARSSDPPRWHRATPIRHSGRPLIGRRHAELGRVYPPTMNSHQHDWKPMESSTAGARCRNCGTHVTQQFARVFGDNGDVVHGCPSCTTYREMQSGGHLPGD